VGVKDGLPILDFADLLVAAQILLDVGRPRRVVDLVPVRLGWPPLVELLLLLPAAAALALLGRGAVDVLVFFGGCPVGELAAGLRRRCCLCRGRW
jgi:hypothetical protein